LILLSIFLWNHRIMKHVDELCQALIQLNCNSSNMKWENKDFVHYLIVYMQERLNVPTNNTETSLNWQAKTLLKANLVSFILWIFNKHKHISGCSHFMMKLFFKSYPFYNLLIIPPFSLMGLSNTWTVNKIFKLV
jgi:hypothetical protein